MSTASDVTQGLSVEKVTGWVGALQGRISRLFQKLRLPAAVTGMLAWCLVAMLAVALFAVVAAAALFWFMVTGKKDAKDGQHQAFEENCAYADEVRRNDEEHHSANAAEGMRGYEHYPEFGWNRKVRDGL